MSLGEFAEIGKYRILGQIGEGAMGVVYRALDPVLNRPVAIKVMSDALARDTDLRGRFLREAQSAGSLQHPNVITIYDFGEVDGHPFIAMEYVEGADLNEVLKKTDPLSIVDKIDVLIDVLNGLSYAHKRGIVHRDIKPANIRIDEEGRARIMDFGIAHLNTSSMTKTGLMVGTPAYMAPEQITGGKVSAASDIFAVGCVMYELLTGVQAMQGESLQSVMYKIVTAPTPSLAMVAHELSDEKNASVSKALQRIVDRALQKDPADRFADAHEMADALSDARLRALDEKEPIRTASLRASVARVMADSPEAKERRKRRRMIGLGVGALALAGAALAVTLSSRNDIKTPSVAATTPPARQASAPPVSALVASPAPPPSIPEAAASAPSNVPSPRERSLFRALHSTALDARRRAAEAGAAAGQLEAGDAHIKTANTLLAQGNAADAGEHLNQAAVAWGTAERAARAASAAASVSAATRTSTAEPPRPQPIASAIPVTSAVTQPQVPQQQLPAPAANPVAEITAAVAAYERALESRDLAAVRRAYPGITAAQARGWEQFFSTLRSLRVSFTISGLDVSGATAEAKLIGSYDYVTEAGKAAQQPVSFQATFRREGGAWQLASVH